MGETIIYLSLIDPVSLLIHNSVNRSGKEMHEEFGDCCRVKSEHSSDCIAAAYTRMEYVLADTRLLVTRATG